MVEKVHILNDALSTSFLNTLCGNGLDILKNISKDKADSYKGSDLCKACFNGLEARSRPNINYVKGKKYISET